MSETPRAIVVMGPSGCGKTSIARALSERLECDFLEGDRRHPPANIRKMESKTPLGDEDRRIWLNRFVAEIIAAGEFGREIVVTCSALRRAYRDLLRTPGRVAFILPELDPALIRRRLVARADHYFTADMLESQLRALESPGADEPDVLRVNAARPLDAIMADLWTDLTARWPGFAERWWRRG
jgi:gluconokinase